MIGPKEYSSLPLVLAISSAIIVSASGGWLILGRDAAVQLDSDNGATTPLAIVARQPASYAAQIDIDAELRKARLAADADLLASPPRQNALFFYGRVLAVDPEHHVANAELEAVIARISLTVKDHVAANEFEDAYDLTVLVAAQKPDDALVETMRESLDNRATGLVEQAIQFVRDGNDADAATALASVEELPGLSPEYVAAARESILEIQQSRIAAERDRLEEERRAAEQAVAEWVEKVRGAIASGRLVAPAGESARDYLAERDTPAETKEQLIDELLVATTTAGMKSIDAGELSTMELHIRAANDLSAEYDGFAELRDTLEGALIEAEGNRLLVLSDFVRLNDVAARYPFGATKRNITGWVDVMFTVTATGATANIEVLQAEPENVFEDSVIEAVEQWTFQPREFRGQPIDQRTAARLVFEIE